MGQRELDLEAHPSIAIIIAGRLAWTNRVRRRISATDVNLVPIGQHEALILDAAIQTAYTALSRRHQPAQLDSKYPNLRRFLEAPQEQRIATLAGPRQPLLAAMLKAVYGEDFYRRIVDEYEELRLPDRTAYEAICLAAPTFGPVSANLLVSIAADADLDARARVDPWVGTVIAGYTPRHSVIGQIVIEEGARPISLQNTFTSLITAAAEQPEALRLLGHIMSDFRTWEPIALNRNPKTSAQLRRIAREGIYANRSLWETCLSTIGGEPLTLTDWAYLLRSQLPDNLTPSAVNIYILQCANDLLKKAIDNSSGSTSGHDERITFYRVVLNRDLRRIRSDPLDDVLDIRVLREYIGNDWCRADFYGELIGICTRFLRDVINTSEFDEDDEVQWMALETLVIAFQYLRTFGPPLRHIQRMYANIIGRRIYGGMRERRIERLRVAWYTSVSLGTPEAALGVMLDSELEIMARKTSGL